MTVRGPKPGDVVLATFPEHDPQGHEQEGLRPAVVLAVPSRPRFPVLFAAPLTTDRGHPWIKAAPHLYLRLPQGVGGLPADSVLLLDQTRSLDASRIRRWIGTLDKKTFTAVLANWIAVFK